MRYRLMALLAMIGFALLSIGKQPAADTRPPGAAIGFAEPQVILDSWDYGARLHPN